MKLSAPFMKRGILFAFLCAFVVGTTAVTLVTASFLRPQAFRQFFFELKLPGWKLTGDQGKSNAEIVTQTNQAIVTIIAVRAVTNVTTSQANNTGSGGNAGSTGDGGSQSETTVQRGTGSGFFIDAAGFIVTNEHVIRNADRIRVRLADGREYKATVQGADAATDIALLKIDAGQLSALTLADSDALRVGDPVIAIGNPLEYEHSVTAGIVSAKGRKVYGEQPFEDFIQTDAAINRGNSGGPLLNKSGEVVGVNTVIRVDSRGISFAVPSNVVRRVVEQLRTTGAVARGYLGLRPETLTEEFREGLGLGNLQGVLVAYVSPDTPAARAGLQPYDVITTLNDRPLTHADDFFSFVASSQPQQQIVVSLVRAGQKMTMHVTLDRRPPDANERQNESRPAIQKTDLPLGFSVRELSPESVQASNKTGEEPRAQSGVIVSEIDPLGPAGEMRWLSGSLIVEANRQPVRNLEDFHKITANLRSGSALVLRVLDQAQRETRLVALRIGEGR